MSDKKVFIMLIALVVAAIAVMIVNKPGYEDTRCNTYNPYPKGIKALFLLLKETGIDAVRYENDMKKLEGEKGALVIINPAEMIGENEAKSIKEWVKKGNKLVCFNNDRDIYYLLNEFGLSMEFRKKNENLPYTLNGFDEKVNKLDIKTDRCYEYEKKNKKGEKEEDAPVYKEILTVNGEKIMVSCKLKDGTALFSSDPAMLTNEYLKNEDNQVFIYNIFKGMKSKVYFDEYHNGYNIEKDPFDEITDTPAFWAVFLQVLAAVLLFLYFRGRRLGKPVPMVLQRRRSSIEFVRSLANLYRMAGARRATGYSLHKSFKSEISDILHLANSDFKGDLKGMFTKRKIKSTDRILYLLNKNNFENLSDSSMLSISREMEIIKKEVKNNAG